MSAIPVGSTELTRVLNTETACTKVTTLDAVRRVLFATALAPSFTAYRVIIIASRTSLPPSFTIDTAERYARS